MVALRDSEMEDYIALLDAEISAPAEPVRARVAAHGVAPAPAE